MRTSFLDSASIPYVSGVIERPRLIEKLQRALEHKLTLICAPPGYGKTTIAAQFAHLAPCPVAWHSIEERERDIPNLHVQCLAALSRVAPGIQSLSPVAGYEPRELVAQVANYLRSTLNGDVLYILDDVQYLIGSPAVEAWLRALVALLPPTVHLVLLSRMLADLPLTEMIARREVLALGQEQLRFTPEEIADLTELFGTARSTFEVEELASRLEGWPAGTILALQPLPTDLERSMLSGGEGPEALFEALSEGVLRVQPPGLRYFLLASSTLTRLTPELCAQALHLTDSINWLGEALKRNLFLTRVSGGLIYHRLFRSFLQRTLQDAYPDLYVDLHAQAAAWFESNNQIEEAFDHYLAAGLIGQARAVAERVARTYFAQSKVETLSNWASRLSRVDAASPQLFYTCAMIYTDRYNYPLAEDELDRAETGFAVMGDQTGINEVQLQRAMINLQCGQYKQAIAKAYDVLDCYGDQTQLRGYALRIIGVAKLRMGDIEEAVDYLEEVLPLYRARGDAYILANVLQDLDTAYIRLGRLDDAAACLQEVVALRRSLGNIGALALSLNNLGYHYHQRGDYQQALITFQEGLSAIAQIQDRRAESYLLWSLGDLQRDRGLFDEALRLYNKAIELIGSSEPSLRCATLVSLSTLRRWQGKLHEALLLADEAAQLAAKHLLIFEGTMAQAAFWTTRAQIEALPQSLLELDTLAQELHNRQARMELVQVYGLSALTAIRYGDTSAAEDYLHSALEVGRSGGSLQPLAAEIIRAPSLETLVQRNDRKYSTLLHHLKRLHEAQMKSAPRVEITEKTEPAITYSVRVRTFGQERVDRDGELLQASDWRAARRKLFFYLLFSGGGKREQICLVFWPDSSAARVRSNFHTTLYRARHALGENVITFQDGMYVISPDVNLWCDAHEFETLTRQARLLSSRDARTEDLWRRAVNLYQGEFLPSLDMEWIDARRETFREAYLEALTGLGKCARARDDYREALALFRRALEIDPYREDVHRAIMNCHAEMGEKKQILSHLQHLQNLLRQDLAVNPSPETLKLANLLLK